MAMYDEMGNYTGYDDAGFTAQPVAPSYDSFGAEVLNDEAQRKKEEELKRQMEEYARQQSELASQVSHKQEVTTYADGSRTVKTTNEIPSAGAGRGFVNPPMAQPSAPVAPQGFDQAAYNASIQQQESGANPNIGYHNRAASSAYGPYGITQGAWQDARRANPNLPQDITQATPEQMQAAQNAVTNNNARYLANYGVEVTPQTLQAAHFLGAKGLSDYLKTGYISPAAAAANGGEANVRRIVDQRLGGQAAAASGAAQAQGPVAPAEPTAEQPAAQPADQYSLATGTSGLGLKTEQPAATVSSQPYIEQYQTAQDNPEALMKLGLDETAPAWMRDRARNRAADLITQNREMEAAKQKLATASETDLARYLREKTTGGSWLKAVFFAAIGAKQLAQEEGAKLGIGTEKVLIGADGKPAIVKISSNGTPLSGYNAETGAKLTPEELVSATAGSGMKGAQTGQTMGYDKNGNVISHTVLPNGQGVIWKNETTGERLKSAPEGYHTGKDQRSMLADTAFKQSMTADETENRKQAAAGLPPLYTPEQIQQRAQAKRDSIMGIGGAQPTAPVAQPVAQPATAVARPQPTGPVAPQTAPAQPAGPVAPAAPLSADLEAQAQSIARGDTKMPTGMGAANRLNQAIRNRVYQINPNYDPTVFDNRSKTENSFTTGKQGDVVRSMNVSIDHLDTLQQAANELKNGNIPVFNDISLRFAEATGQPAPKNFDALKTLVGSEVAKAVQGGATALGDREEIRKEIDRAGSPAQLAGVIDKYQHLLAGQMNGLKTQYESGGGRRWDSKINDRTREVMNKIEQEKNPVIPGTNVTKSAIAAEIARRRQAKEQQ